MHRQDSAGALGDERLYLGRVKGVVVGLDVGEDRLEPLAHDGVGGGGKGEGGGDDLVTPVSSQLHGLEDAFQS